MIDRIEGKVIERDPTHLVIQTGGIGFYVSVSLHTYEATSRKEQVTLFTHFVVREDAMLLFGFATREERETFRILIGVSGIGPKVAQALLSSLNVRTLRDSVRAGDWKRLTATPGVGRKLAERMVVELREAFGKGDDGDSTGSVELTGYNGPAGNVYETVKALVSLGYPQANAEKLAARAAKLAGEDAGVEDLIRLALKP